MNLSSVENVFVSQPCRDNTLYLLRLVDEMLISEVDHKLPVYNFLRLYKLIILTEMWSEILLSVSQSYTLSLSFAQTPSFFSTPCPFPKKGKKKHMKRNSNFEITSNICLPCNNLVLFLHSLGSFIIRFLDNQDTRKGHTTYPFLYTYSLYAHNSQDC